MVWKMQDLLSLKEYVSSRNKDLKGTVFSGQDSSLHTPGNSSYTIPRTCDFAILDGYWGTLQMRFSDEPSRGELLALGCIDGTQEHQEFMTNEDGGRRVTITREWKFLCCHL